MIQMTGSHLHIRAAARGVLSLGVVFPLIRVCDALIIAILVLLCEVQLRKYHYRHPPGYMLTAHSFVLGSLLYLESGSPRSLPIRRRTPRE
jgi:hypothetical protein